MANSYSKAKGRNGNGRFVALPHRYLAHENFIRLTPKAIKLFIDICMQYNGSNNGDLTTAFTLLKKRGWRSKQTLYLAIDELLHYGWIIRTRIGGLNKTPHLYALTFHSIDGCGGKIDIEPTNVPPGNWNSAVGKWTKPERYRSNFNTLKNKSRVQTQYRNGTNVVPMATKIGGS